MAQETKPSFGNRTQNISLILKILCPSESHDFGHMYEDNHGHLHCLPGEGAGPTQTLSFKGELPYLFGCDSLDS